MKTTLSARNLTPLLMLALKEVPREEWSASNKVAHAYLHCPRLHKIVVSIEQKMRARAIAGTRDDIYQSVWIIIQPKLIELDAPENVYSWLYRTIELQFFTARNENKKTAYVEDIADHETEDESGDTLLDKMAIESGMLQDETANTNDRLDREAQMRLFAAKLARCGWPSHIPDNKDIYRRIGRPRKDA